MPDQVPLKTIVLTVWLEKKQLKILAYKDGSPDLTKAEDCRRVYQGKSNLEVAGKLLKEVTDKLVAAWPRDAEVSLCASDGLIELCPPATRESPQGSSVRNPRSEESSRSAKSKTSATHQTSQRARARRTRKG